MSIANALSNAVTGLAAVSRGTEVVSDNLANLQTLGYARRELVLTSRGLAGNSEGVRIEGISRVVNAGLLAEQRNAAAAKAEASKRLDFLRKMEDVIGLPGSPGGLGGALTAFQANLIDASERPENENRLLKLAQSAKELTVRLNAASEVVQTTRMKAESDISSDVKLLGDSLAQVSYLNRRISIIYNQGKDSSPLIDERQSTIDQINRIVPVQVIPRNSGKVALFTRGGTPLLEGDTPSKIEFEAAPLLSAALSADDSSVGRLIVGGKELSASRMSFFSGGTLSANFEIRDDLATRMQQELDSFALELYERFSDPAVDPTISSENPGLFVDDSDLDVLANMRGFATRISLNRVVDPSAAGELWRLRDGMGAEQAGPSGDATLIIAMENALRRQSDPPAGSVLQEAASLGRHLAIIESRANFRRATAEADSVLKNSQAYEISQRFLSDGVSLDAELHRLLEFEQAYAANARVIQAIDEMMNQILRW